jgi:hypothetical protein
MYVVIASTGSLLSFLPLLSGHTDIACSCPSTWVAGWMSCAGRTHARPTCPFVRRSIRCCCWLRQNMLLLLLLLHLLSSRQQQQAKQNPFPRFGTTVAKATFTALTATDYQSKGRSLLLLRGSSRAQVKQHCLLVATAAAK